MRPTSSRFRCLISPQFEYSLGDIVSDIKEAMERSLQDKVRSCRVLATQFSYASPADWVAHSSFEVRSQASQIQVPGVTDADSDTANFPTNPARSSPRTTT